MKPFKPFPAISLAAIAEVVARTHAIELVREAAGGVFSIEAQRKVIDQIYPGLGRMNLDIVVQFGNDFKRKFSLPDSIYDERDREEVRQALLKYSEPSSNLVQIKGQTFAISPIVGGTNFDGDTFNV